MTAALTFAAGLVIGGLLVFLMRRASRAPANPTIPKERLESFTPVATLLAERDSLETALPADDRFASLCCELLEDVVAHHQAQAGAMWKLQGREMILEVVAGDRSVLTANEAALAPLIEWSAREGFVQLGPDGDAPIAGIAPLIGGQTGARDARASGALALVFAQPYAGDRAELKRWLHRYGEQFARLGELVRTHDELAKTNKRTRTLLRETQNWDVEERPADLGVRLCAMVEQLTGAEGAALVRWDEDAHIGSVAIADGSCAQYAGSTVDEDSLAGTACREDVPQLWHDIGGRGESAEFLFSRSLPTQKGCVLVQPLRRRGSVIGAVVATHRSPGKLGSAELRALSLFDAVASFRIASAWKLEEVSRRAIVDGLTGLMNREGFEAEMRAALGEQMRYGWEMSLVIIDVDHFKLVNDTHGHEVGDAVLRAIARVLDEGVRTTDVSARVGGEEMALILKDTGVDGARELSERLRAGIEALRIPFGTEEIRVTASFGIATYPTHVAEWAGLYRAADRALYEAKASGRNQVKVEGGDVRTPRRSLETGAR